METHTYNLCMSLYNLQYFSGDLAFDGFDYLLIFTNDLLTAAYGKSSSDSP